MDNAHLSQLHEHFITMGLVIRCKCSFNLGLSSMGPCYWSDEVRLTLPCLCLRTLGFNTDHCKGHGLETMTNPSTMGAYFPACFPQGSASRPPGSPLQEGFVATGLVGFAKQKPARTMRAYFPYCSPCGPSGAMSACKRAYYGGETCVSRFGELYN